MGRAVAMASLATVCGVMEQEVTDMRSETISALKALNDYFYRPLSSSSQSQTFTGNFNKRLLKPQSVDGSRLVDAFYYNTSYSMTVQLIRSLNLGEPCLENNTQIKNLLSIRLA